MATITAAMVKDLREKTGAGMMDCKGALNEVGGDIEAAIDWLRKKGLSKAAKKAGRTAAEGLIAVESPGRSAAMVEVNSETDFVARNESFQAFAREAAKIALMTDGSLAALEAEHFPGSSTTVKDRLQELIATVGENMSLRRVAKLTVQHGIVATYVHSPVHEGLGKIGVLVALESEGDVSALSKLGGQIAQHVAAMNPDRRRCLGRRSRDGGARERDPARQECRQARPRAGQDRRERPEVLLQGVHAPRSALRDPRPRRQDLHAGPEGGRGKVGKPVKLTGFVRYALGEGIAKEETDFAAEVAAQSGVGKAPDGEGART